MICVSAPSFASAGFRERVHVQSLASLVLAEWVKEVAALFNFLVGVVYLFAFLSYFDSLSLTQL